MSAGRRGMIAGMCCGGRGRTGGVLALLSLGALIVTLGAWARSYLPEDLHAACVDGKLVLIFAESALSREWASAPGKDGETHPVPTAELWRKVQRGRYLGPTNYTPIIPAPQSATATRMRVINTPPR